MMFFWGEVSICAIAVRLINEGDNPMKYVLLIYMDENALSDTEREDCYVASAQLGTTPWCQGTVLGDHATAPCSDRHSHPGTLQAHSYPMKCP